MNAHTTPQPHRPVLIWLGTVFAMIVAMVALGGITRLTGSGLSMVEWKPLFGAIPPLGDADWQALFHKYKQFPQYQQVNHWMGLTDFKTIFFWEYLHRLWGRLIGLVFFLPLVLFWWRGQLDGTPKGRIVIAFVLGGLQGVVGWIMVKSGLVDRPEVSHLRLAIHFGLALFVSQWILWLWLQIARVPRAPLARGLKSWLHGFAGLLALQLIYGAFMAGSRAGYVYATFPSFNGEYLPAPLRITPDLWAALVHNPVGIHFVHRMLGYLLLVVAIVLVARLYRQPAWRRYGLALLTLLLGQTVLGIWTVMSHVDIVAAVLHQLGGVAVLSLTTWMLYRGAGGDVGGSA